MMKIADLTTVLQIIGEYDPDADFSVGHDQIWVGTADIPLTAEQVAVMDRLGWFVDEEFECWSLFT